MYWNPGILLMIRPLICCLIQDQIIVTASDNSGNLVVRFHQGLPLISPTNNVIELEVPAEKIRASVQNLDITDLSEVQIRLNFGGSDYLMTCSNPKIVRI